MNTEQGVSVSEKPILPHPRSVEYMRPRKSKFLSLLTAAAFVVCLASPLWGQDSAVPVNNLWEAFQNPPMEARASCYWWWKGKLTAPEMGRQLRLLKAAGLGGAHIVPWDSEPAYLSPEWLEILKSAVEAARKENMILDLSGNAKWPFRGDWVPESESLQKIDLEAVSLDGPKTYSLPSKEPAPKKKGKLRSTSQSTILQAQLARGELSNLDQLRDVTSTLRKSGRVEVPAGRHTLYIVRLTKDVKKTELGRVPDHFNQRAIENYLGGFKDRVAPVLGGSLGNGLRAIYCDSIELSESNWSPLLLEEFKRRRGYDLSPYLPLVLNAVPRSKAPENPDTLLGRTVRRVRYDYCRTLVDMFQEGLPHPFQKWCHENGVLCRWQAYGWPWFYGIDDGYRIPDIPEGNSWLFTGSVFQGDVDMIGWPIWQKYAASGAHQTGRRITSTESMTVVEGKFKETLDLVKRADDFNFVSGINHSFLHGFCYSPANEPFPGRNQYGTYFSEHNPWWPYMRHWMDYNARLSALFQAAAPVAQVALLFRNADIWSEAGLHRHPFQLDPPWAHQVWRWMNQSGVNADYISDMALQNATFDDGLIQFGPMRYQALVVLGVNTIEPETAEAIARYAQAGGKVAFVGALPDASPGLKNAAARDAKVRTTMQNIIASHPRTVMHRQPPGIATRSLTNTWLESLNAWRQSTSSSELLAWTGQLLTDLQVKQSIRFDPPVAGLYHVHYRGATNEDVYFFANTTDASITGRAALASSGNHLERWDPETGTRSEFPVDAAGFIKLSLRPAGSLLLIASPGTAARLNEEAKSPEVADVPLTNAWSVAFAPAQGNTFEIAAFPLASLAAIEDPRINRFSGQVTYRTTFRWTENRRDAVLNLGAVPNCVTEATLNGQKLGVRWHGPHEYDAGNALKEGENKLEVKAVTTLWNCLRKQDQAPEPSGLIGPVKLTVERN